MGSMMNRYGDVMIPTTGVHGSDVSSQRVDELDTACLEFIESRAAAAKTTTALDIGGGHAAHTKRMADRGVQVLLIDLTDQSRNIDFYNKQVGRQAIYFQQGDVRDFTPRSAGMLFDVVYSQRMLSCIRYQEAHDLISKISNVCSREAYFFISAGGLHTEVGREYSDRALPIEARWGKTSPEMAQKHQLFAPECLYAEEDLVALLTSCGLEVVRAWTSEFGNPKAICRR